jgi:formate dehydrogenase subunit gamma
VFLQQREKTLMAQIENNVTSGKSQAAIFDSTSMVNVGEPAKNKLPGYYFPLVIGIVIIEAVVLILVLLDVLPIHPFTMYSYAAYFNLISPADTTHIGVIITRWFFFLLTAGVLIPTTAIIAMEITRRVINYFRGPSNAWDEEYPILEKLDKAWKSPTSNSERIEGNYVKRFDVHQRIQHYMLFISFIILGVTGLLRGFPEWPTFQWFTTIFGGPEVLRIVHDAAALVMVIDCIYHIFYIAYGIVFQRRLPMAMVPSLKDMKDMLHTFLWIFGQVKEEPQYERFQYGQKIDYWAIFWGMPVMVITGTIMMFTVFFSKFLPGWAFGVIATAHRDEAVLAVGFILIVHMYYGHLQSNVFPVNTVMFTGKMLKAKYQQWFHREYGQITGENKEKG